MAKTSITIGIEKIGEPEPGLWCPECALPSGARVPLMLMWDGRPGEFMDFRVCFECGLELTDA